MLYAIIFTWRDGSETRGYVGDVPAPQKEYDLPPEDDIVSSREIETPDIDLPEGKEWMVRFLDSEYINGEIVWVPISEQWVIYIREIRDGVLKKLLELIDIYRHKLEGGYATSITSEQKMDCIHYLETLRNWPDNAVFPDDSLPALPVSISQLKSKLEWETINGV